MTHTTTGYENITITTYKAQFLDQAQAHVLLDVRTSEEFHDFRIPGSVNIPLDELPDRVAEVANLAGQAPIVMVCKSGVRSIMGAQVLRYAGLQQVEIFNLDSGTKGWADHNLPLEP